MPSSYIWPSLAIENKIRSLANVTLWVQSHWLICNPFLITWLNWLEFHLIGICCGTQSGAAWESMLATPMQLLLYLWDHKNTLFVWRDTFLIKLCQQEFIKMPSFLALLPLSHCRNLRACSPRAWVTPVKLLKTAAPTFFFSISWSFLPLKMLAWMQADYEFFHLLVLVYSVIKSIWIKMFMKGPRLSNALNSAMELGRFWGGLLEVFLLFWYKKIQ